MSKQEHMDKRSFDIITDDGYKEIDNFLIFREGFMIDNNRLYLDIDNQTKFDKLCDSYKKHIFRIKYNKFSKFFREEDLLKSNSNLLDYLIFDISKKDGYVKQRVPLDTFITDNMGNRFNLNNYILKISYDAIQDRLSYLPISPVKEFEKLADGELVHYLTSSNILVFNTRDKYINIKEVINNGSLVLHKEYNLENSVVKNALIYNEKLIGIIENENKFFCNPLGVPHIKLHGNEIDISLGISASIDEMEELIYYKDVDQLVGQISYNEYNIGDLLYAKNENKLYFLTNTGTVDVDVNSIIYDYNEPDNPKIGMLWFNMSYSNVNFWDGYMWKQLSIPSLETICKKINLDRKYNLSKSYLEVYGYNEDDELSVLEMYLNTDIVKDIEFDLGDNFIDSIFINGDESTTYKEANYGVHLVDPAFKGDLFQAIIVKNKEYHWTSANVIDERTIRVNYPFEVNSVRKVLLNEEELFINNIENNAINITELINNNKDFYPVLNVCDRVKAKIKIGQKLSKVYPSFVVNYDDNLDSIELPFDMAANRFDKLMVTNNGEEVILNPEIIVEPDKLHAYYSSEEIHLVKFNRNITLEDNVVIHFIKHVPCKFNPESMFDGINTSKDIEDKIIKDSMVDIADPDISLDFILSQVDKTETEKVIADKVYKVAVITGIEMPKETEDERIQKIVDEAVKKSSPSISATAIATQPVANKYNLRFTKSFMAHREELKKYLFDLNSKFSKILSELMLARDALRGLINYLCNTMCLKEILQGLMELYNGLVGGLKKVGDILKGMTLEKFKNLMKNLWDKANAALEKMSEFMDNLFGGVFDFFKDTWNKLMNSVKAMAQAGMKMLKSVGNAFKKVWDMFKKLFNKFKETNIGEEAAKYASMKKPFGMSSIFKKMWGGIKKVFKGIWTGIKSIGKGFVSLWNNMKKLWNTIVNWDKWEMFAEMNLAQIIDYICNKVLRSLLNSIDNIINHLSWLQQRFQRLLYRAFADNYRSPLNYFDYLTTCASFFKSHINICQILKEILATPDSMKLSVFVKRVTNLETLFYQWQANKRILKSMNQGIMPYGDNTDIGSIANNITNSVLLVDDLSGINYKTIEMIIANLKRAFIPNMKVQAGSILDKQAMSRKLFGDVEYFKYLGQKIVPF